MPSSHMQARTDTHKQRLATQKRFFKTHTEPQTPCTVQPYRAAVEQFCGGLCQGGDQNHPWEPSAQDTPPSPRSLTLSCSLCLPLLLLLPKNLLNLLCGSHPKALQMQSHRIKLNDIIMTPTTKHLFMQNTKGMNGELQSSSNGYPHSIYLCQKKPDLHSQNPTKIFDLQDRN